MLETSSRDWEDMFLRRRRGVKTDPREKRKNPASAGLFQCAREDSNLHGPFGPQGPQPCASTSSATGASGPASIETAPLPPWPLMPSDRSPTLRTSVRTIAKGTLMADVKLTKRQQQIFDFIKRHTSEKGYPPTVRDIGQAVGLTSSSTVHAHLLNIERAGVLRRDPTKPRAMEVIAERAKRIVAPPGLPLVGRVAAGTPILAEENIEDYFDVSPLAAGDQGDFVLTVRG